MIESETKSGTREVIQVTDELKDTNTPYYTNAANYWENIDPSIDGMLGGFAKVSPLDLEESGKFLKHLFKTGYCAEKDRALDCGAGIGRISKNLLKRHNFKQIDLVEQNKHFLDKAVEYLGPDHKGKLLCCGLQNFTPEEKAYDLIWCQWVLGHLTDEHFVSFFQRCSNGIKEHGLIVVKENVTSSGEVEFDKDDSSVTRPDEKLRSLFERAGLNLVLMLDQKKFPQGLYKVKMYALSPFRA